MEYKQATSAISNMAKQIKQLMLTVVALIACNAVLGLLLWHESGRTTTVLVPAGLQKAASVSPLGVSTTYLEAMATMLVNARLNITPATAQGADAEVLRFVAPSYYSAFKQSLLNEQKTVANDKIVSAFYINQVRTNPSDLRVVVSGHLQRWVGERSIGTEQKTYQLDFNLSGTQLLLRGFTELTPKSS